MKKILILLGVVVLVLVGFFLCWGSPWTPSRTANYFWSLAYEKDFEPLGIGKLSGGGGHGESGRERNLSRNYLLSGDSQVIVAEVEKMRSEVDSLLKQDGAHVGASSTGGVAGSYVFSYDYTTLAGRYGHCSVIVVPISPKALPPYPSTELFVIFYER